MSSLIANPIIHIFPLISLFGLYVVSNLMINSGHAQAFADSLKDIPFRLLPDGKTSVQTSYTGLGPVDSYLANLQFIFVPLVDGSSPQLSLLGWHWAGLLLALFTVLLVESLRTRRARDLVFFVFWGLAIQYCGYFVTMPIYCYVHLLRSKNTQVVASTPQAIAASGSNLGITAIRVVPISILLGYVLPSVIMCMPYIHSGKSRQLAIAFWQNFPIWIAAVQMAAMWFASRRSLLESQRLKQQVNTQTPIASSSSQQSSQQLLLPRAEELNKSIKQIYKTTAILSAIIHISGLLPIILATIHFQPSILRSLSPSSSPFPLITTPNLQSLQSLQPTAFFLPPKWDGNNQISDMAEGAWNFLRYDYYIGTVAALVWVVVLRFSYHHQDGIQKQNGVVGSGWRKGVEEVVVVVGSVVVFGPGFAIVRLMGEYEDGLLEEVRKRGFVKEL